MYIDAGDGGARSMDSSHLSLLRERRSSPLETVLRIEELDWRDNVDFLKPPFDVLLIADVVCSCSSGVCENTYCTLNTPSSEHTNVWQGLEPGHVP